MFYLQIRRQDFEQQRNAHLQKRHQFSQFAVASRPKAFNEDGFEVGGSEDVVLLLFRNRFSENENAVQQQQQEGDIFGTFAPQKLNERT